MKEYQRKQLLMDKCFNKGFQQGQSSARKEFLEMINVMKPVNRKIKGKYTEFLIKRELKQKIKILEDLK